MPSFHCFLVLDPSAYFVWSATLKLLTHLHHKAYIALPIQQMPMMFHMAYQRNCSCFDQVLHEVTLKVKFGLSRPMEDIEYRDHLKRTLPYRTAASYAPSSNPTNFTGTTEEGPRPKSESPDSSLWSPVFVNSSKR